MIIAGLKKAGTNPQVVDIISGLLSDDRVHSAEDLVVKVRQYVVAHNGLELLSDVERINERWLFNRSCYDRYDPIVAGAIQWPNNPQIKAIAPESYTDIFTAKFSRQRRPLIGPSTPIGSAGSCFALRIAHQLQAWGYNYVIEEDDLPEGFPIDNLPSTGFRMSPARVGTLFNVPSMRQMVQRAFGVWSPEKLFLSKNGRFIDPFRSISASYDSIPGYLADYESHSRALRRALLKCKVFVLTLGLTEAWKFAHSDEFTSLSPSNIDPTLLIPVELSVEDNVRELEQLYSTFKLFNPDIHLIVSVSPVPLNKTFSSTDHVVVANSLSKATLRVAAESFCRNHPESTSYFPSFEVVLYGTKNPWESDMRHVSSDAIERVMQLFQYIYFDSDRELKPLRFAEPVPVIPRLAWARRFLRPIKRRLTRKS